MVGAQAVGIHAIPRATGDLDVWVGTHRENPAHVWSALHAFGAPLDNLSIDDLRQPNLIFQMGVVPVRIDVITSVEGLAFEECWPRRITARYGDLDIPVIGLDDLIVNKRAVGRTRDLADVELLEKIRKRIR
ncbi:MAG: hypothetical protein ACT4P6_23525 [Gemmatimonadaceae bacterium]